MVQSQIKYPFLVFIHNLSVPVSPSLEGVTAPHFVLAMIIVFCDKRKVDIGSRNETKLLSTYCISWEIHFARLFIPGSLELFLVKEILKWHS